jgi:thiol-disulfide isomerase/thioredoxin
VRISPHLVELQRRFGALNFTVVAINADRFLELEVTDEQRAAYVKKEGFEFPVAYLDKKMQQDYGNLNVYPTLFLVDTRGVIQKQYVSYQSWDTLSKDVSTLLKEEQARSLK